MSTRRVQDYIFSLMNKPTGHFSSCFGEHTAVDSSDQLLINNQDSNNIDK